MKNCILCFGRILSQVGKIDGQSKASNPLMFKLF